MLVRDRELIRAAVDGHGGNEVSTPAEGFFVVFALAKDAVAAAVAARWAHAAEPWPDGSPRGADGTAHGGARARELRVTSAWVAGGLDLAGVERYAQAARMLEGFDRPVVLYEPAARS